MNATTSPDHKFAFLFTGNKDAVHCEYLRLVYETLTVYYAYKPENIKTVYGTDDVSTIANPVGSPLAISNQAELETAIEDFMNDPPTAGAHSMRDDPGDGNNTVLIFICGDIDTSNNFIINNDNAVASAVTGSGLTSLFQPLNMSQAYSDFHYVIVSDHALYFTDEMVSGMFVLRATFTASCGNGETNPPGFVEEWTNGLRLTEKMVGSAATADRINSAIADDPDHLVSLKEASIYASGIGSNLYQDRIIQASDEGNYFLGKPLMYINDGPDNARWRSEDIWLTHPDPPYNTDAYKDLYLCDDPDYPDTYNNTVNVRARNLGTHPVRSYWLGAVLTPTGTTPDGESSIMQIDIHALEGASYKPLVPGEADSGDSTDPADTCQQTHIGLIGDMFFDDAGHRCVRARLNTEEIMPAELNSMSVYANDNEAQRNVNPIEICEKSGDTGGGEDEEDDKDVKGKSITQYVIKNTFKEKRRFRLLFPRDYEKALKLLDFKWDWGRAIAPYDGFDKEKLFEKKEAYIDLLLMPGETRVIGLKLSARKGVSIKEPLELDFDVLLEGRWDRRLLPHYGRLFKPYYASVGGFTLSVKTGRSDIYGFIKTVEDVRITKIHLRTPGSLQEQYFEAEKDGSFSVKGLNPGNYYMSVISKQGRSQEYLFRLANRERKELNMALYGKRLVPSKSRSSSLKG